MDIAATLRKIRSGGGFQTTISPSARCGGIALAYRLAYNGDVAPDLFDLHPDRAWRVHRYIFEPVTAPEYQWKLVIGFVDKTLDWTASER